MEIWEMLQPI